MVGIVLAALLGMIMGGFINVLADDLPVRDGVHRPHYPDGAPRAPSSWLGTLAFVTGRRASPAGIRLSWRHPIVEVGLGAAFALVAASYPLDVHRLFQLVFLSILLLITVIDIEHKLILFVVIWPSCLIAVIASLLTPAQPDLASALIGGAAGFLLFYLVYLGGIAFSELMGRLRGEAMAQVAFGFGDVMLATLSGLILGWQALIFALILTVVLGAVGAVIYLLLRLLIRGQYTLFTALPYGPYIVLGTVIMMFWRDEVRALLLG